jgi:hypothetical protein
MLEDYIEVIPEIIKAASASSLGILALIIVALSILAYGFFRNEGPKIKLFVFLILVSGSTLFVQQMYSAEPVMAATESVEDNLTSPEKITPPAGPEPTPIPPPKVATKPLATVNKPPKVTTKSLGEIVAKQEGGFASMPTFKKKASIQSHSKTTRARKPQRVAKSQAVSMVPAKSSPPICKPVWTPWQKPTKKINNICAPGCFPGKKLSKSFRIVSFPPKPQVRYQIKCSTVSR